MKLGSASTAFLRTSMASGRFSAATRRWASRTRGSAREGAVVGLVVAVDVGAGSAADAGEGTPSMSASVKAASVAARRGYAGIVGTNLVLVTPCWDMGFLT